MPVVLALMLASSACARRTDERVRDAWGGSTRAPDAAGPGRGDVREGGGAEPGEAPIRVGWERMDEILDRALTEAALGTDAELFAQLAGRWCNTEPEPKRTDDGPLLVCMPDPPVLINGSTFSLELGGAGVIGLVASDLTAEDSSTLVQEALGHHSRWCSTEFRDVSPPPSPSDSKPPADDAELHLCPVEGSALLVVGRFRPTDRDGAQSSLWQVSVAVIDAS